MCEKATEIQKQAPYLKMTVQHKGTDGNMYLCFKHKYAHWNWCGYMGGIWLPRQDQLQAMLIGKYDMINLFVVFTDWTKGTLAGGGQEIYKECEFENFASFEQLWLAFVMKEEYNKIWNGKEWREEKEDESKR